LSSRERVRGVFLSWCSSVVASNGIVPQTSQRDSFVGATGLSAAAKGTENPSCQVSRSLCAPHAEREGYINLRSESLSALHRPRRSGGSRGH
jgi:hypothetical protein